MMDSMKRFISVALTLCFSAGVSLAQLPTEEQQSNQTQMPSSQSIPSGSFGNMFTSSSDFFKNLQSQGLLIQSPPYDRSVDTNKYVLGPGDVVNIGIWGVAPVTLDMSITPEGTLIVPRVGVLDVGGMTLAEAKSYARKEISKQFKNAPVTLTLIYPRSFYVIVSGMVRHPGRYVVNSFDRVDRAFSLANLTLNSLDTTRVFPSFSLRKIRLIHRDGSVEDVDLLRFYMTGNLTYDPYLRQGDAIVVPVENLASGSISISGAVKMPGNFEFVPGDRIKDLLELSAGMTGLADSSHAKILFWNGKTYDDTTVNLTDSSSLNTPLAANSRVVIPTDWSKVNDFYVWVEGNVENPGIYPISRDSTKLSTIIDLAGGFTKWASLPDAKIFRKTSLSHGVHGLRIDSLTFVLHATGISQEELVDFSNELLMRLSTEVVSTDFVKLFLDKDESYDRTLQSGDSIYVPHNRSAVYVYGQIKNSGYVDYHNNWNYSDYVEAAGGFGNEAETKDIKIIKGRTYQWVPAGDTRIEPGDLIYVPKVTIKPELYSWNLFKDILATVGAAASIVTTIILVIQTSKGK